MSGPATALEDAIKAAMKGSSEAKVLRPAEKQLAEREAAQNFKQGLEASQAPAEATVRPSEPTTRVNPSSQPVRPSEPTTRVTPKAEPAPLEDMPSNPQPPKGTADTPPGVKPPVTPKPAPIFRTPGFAAGATVDADARSMVQANLANYDTEATHMLNFDVINTGDDIKAAIAHLADQNQVAIEAERGPAVLHTQLAALADDLGINQQAITDILGRESGTGVPDIKTIIGTRQFINASAEQLKTLAAKIDDGLANDFEKVYFTRQIQLHNAVYSKFMGARADWGRTGHAFGMPLAGDTAQLSRINDILASTDSNIKSMAKAIRMAGSVNGVSAIARTSLLRRSLKASENLVIRNMINGILSGPTTHVVNTLGNGMFLGMNLTEMAIASRVGRFFSPDEAIQAGEAMATLHGMVQGTSDAWRLAGRALRTGETIDNQVKFGIAGTNQTTTRLPELDAMGLGGVVRGLDTVVGLPTRLLGAEDEFFKAMEFRGGLTRQAFVEANNQLKAGTLEPKDVEAFMRQYLENPPPEAEKAAEEWAREMTFQSQLGPFGQHVQGAINAVPLLRMIAPFIQTPTNIFKQAAYRSPVALMAPKFWQDVAAGGAKRHLALTRFGLGTATAGMVAYWVANDQVTGAGPQDPSARMLWMANGKRPYSVKYTDPFTGNVTYKSYARMEPAASVIGSIADTAEIYAALSSNVETLDPDQEKAAYQAAGAIVAGIMNNTGNKTFMKGIADFAAFVNDPSREIKGYAGTMVTAQIPYSALLRSIRNLKDPYLREAWTIQDKIRDTLPGFSEDLPINPGLFGEPREKNSSSLLGALTPWPESEEKYDSVYKEAAKVMQETNKVPLTMPSRLIEGLQLSPQEYAELVKIGRTMPLFDSGTMTLHDKLLDVMTSDTYQMLPPIGKAEQIRYYQTQADNAARAMLPEYDPKFAQKIEDWRIRKARLTGRM